MKMYYQGGVALTLLKTVHGQSSKMDEVKIAPAEFPCFYCSALFKVQSLTALATTGYKLKTGALQFRFMTLTLKTEWFHFQIQTAPPKTGIHSEGQT